MFSNFKRRISRLRRQDERGSILILVILSALIIVGSAGLAVDVGRMYATKAELSRTVDAAALAGVLEFNGTAAGLTNAGSKAEAYLLENKVDNETLTVNKSVAPATCTMTAPSAACVVADGGQSRLSINARKETRLYFLPIFGINKATVSAKAMAGFNDQTLDAVMVIDATASMNGTPLTNAKTAAISFKNTLLGSSPSGNVKVGVAPLRGCYRPDPMPAAKSDCIDTATQVVELTHVSGTLDTKINALTSGSASATNICTGLGKGYQVLNNAATNHETAPNNRRFLVLLSDGDNYYKGDYTYQASPASPESFAVGAGTYSCRPPDTCTSWGTPCSNGTYPGSTVDVASDNFDSGTTSGGTGWAGNWTTTSGSPTITTSGTPTQSGSRHLRIAQTDTIYRVVNLSGVTAASLSYYWKHTGWDSGDNVLVQCSTSTSGWTTLRDRAYGSTANTSYAEDTITLPSACRNSATVYIRFQGSIDDSNDYFYVDDITVSNTGVVRDGYLDGGDGQSPTSCNESPKPRERQLDVQTLNLANAIKAQNVEIFVVAFTACTNTDGNTFYNNSGNVSCNSQSNPVSSPPASGRVGDTMAEDHANGRLAKCIASSTPGTNDHYWWSNDASALPGIFTTIAAQIAHRLVE